MEEDSPAQPEDEEPQSIENGSAPQTDVPTDEEDEEEGVMSIVFQDDRLITRKIQTEMTVEPLLQPTSVAPTSEKISLKPSTTPYMPCGDMPLPPGADPWQWGFPEYCPKKMRRYAEAAAAAEAYAAVRETGVDNFPTPLGIETVSEVMALRPVTEEHEEAMRQEPSENVLSVLSFPLSVYEGYEKAEEKGGEESSDEGVAAAGEPPSEEVEGSPEAEVRETPSEEVFLDAVGDQQQESAEKVEGEATTETDEATLPVEVDIEIGMLATERAYPDFVEFQEIAVTEKAEASIESTRSAQTDEVPREDVDIAFHDQYTKEIHKMEPTFPVLWKIEQDIATVRTKLNEMQERITALDLPGLSGASSPDGLNIQRSKCLCEIKKLAAERRLLFATQPTAGTLTTPYPPLPRAQAVVDNTGSFGKRVPPESAERYGYPTSTCLTKPACITQYTKHTALPNVMPGLRPTSGASAGMDIYIASRSGKSNALTSINSTNVCQYADKPILKAFESPDVDVYVVTDTAAGSGSSVRNCIQSASTGSS